MRRRRIAGVPRVQPPRTATVQRCQSSLQHQLRRVHAHGAGRFCAGRRRNVLAEMTKRESMLHSARQDGFMPALTLFFALLSFCALAHAESAWAPSRVWTETKAAPT